MTVDEQVAVTPEILGDSKNYLSENLECPVLFWNHRVISVEVPNFVELQITKCDPGVRGDTVSGAGKPATLSTGAVVSFGLVYPHVFGTDVNLTPQIDALYDISGTSPNTLPFVKGRLAVTPSLNFEYLNKWRASISYTSFAGGGTNNLMADRDYLAINFSYSF